MQQAMNTTNKTTREMGKQVKFNLPLQKQKDTFYLGCIFPLPVSTSDEILPFDHYMNWPKDAM